MYASHGNDPRFAWDEYTHLDAPEATKLIGFDRATGVYTKEDDEGSTLIAWTLDEEPKHNTYHAQHVLSRRPLVEMLRDAAATGYLERTAHGINQGPATFRSDRARARV